MVWAWLIPVLSFAAVPLIILFGKRLPGKGSPLAILAILAGFAIFWVVFAGFLSASPDSEGCEIGVGTEALTCNFQITWFEAGIPGADTRNHDRIEVAWGMTIDPLTVAMLGLATFVALMVQIYSLGYMHGDTRIDWYFAFHALFIASMLTLVLADNFLLLYVAWELVGLCSYLFNRLLARTARTQGGGQEGVYRYPHWRRGTARWHPAALESGGQLQHDRDLRRRGKRCAERWGNHHICPAAVPGGHGQVGPVSLPRLAARRHGRPHAGQCADSRGHDGGGRGVPGGPGLPPVQRVGHRNVGGGHHRPDYGAGSGDHRAGGHGLETHTGVFDYQPLGFDDAVPGGVWLHRGNIPPAGPRICQGAALPGRPAA